MSELAKKARQAMKSKASSLVRTDPKKKVDASGYTPPDALDADVKTGMRPVSRRQFKKGGKVVAVHGKEAVHHAGKKPRKSGGRLLTADSLINRNQKEANQDRDGSKHIGGMKRGGRTHKQMGGAMADPRMAALMRDPRAMAAARMMAAKAGMPMARKSGGKTEHSDEAEDKALIKSMIKSSAMKHGKAHGGSCDCPACTSMRSRKAHGGSCRCAKCMGGYTKKADGGELMDITDNDQPPKGGPGSTISDPAERKRFLDSFKSKPKPPPKKRGGSMSVSDGSLQGTRPTGGRLARKSGGRAKGKMNVNIIIGAHRHPDGAAMGAGAPMGGLDGLLPPGMRQGVPPQFGGAGAPPMPPQGMPMPPQGAPMPPAGLPMARKSGGRVPFNPKQHGGGGGLGRLQKLKAYGDKAKATKEHY